MSDLISKSETIDLLYQVFEKHSMATDKNDFLGGFGAELFKNIKAMPTAYSVDKGDMKHNLIVRDTAIEIVKHGGVCSKCTEAGNCYVREDCPNMSSDDVCEWKPVSNGEFIQNPHTKRLYSNEPSMQNVYCNTCGKKIKVVN